MSESPQAKQDNSGTETTERQLPVRSAEAIFSVAAAWASLVTSGVITQSVRRIT